MVEEEKKPVLWHGRAFDFKVENTTLPNGRETTFGVIQYPGSCGVIPLIEPDSILLVHQFRPSVGERIWEIPAGTMDPGESPLECARRELREETGFSASRFEKLGEILVAPGYSDERIHLFLATDLVPSKQNLDEDEVLTAQVLAFDRVLKMMEKGKILDAMTIIGIDWGMRRAATARNRLGETRKW